MIISTRTQCSTVQAMKAKWTSLKMDISKVKKWSKAIACMCLVGLLPAHAVNAATYFFHNGHLGTPPAWTDSNQQVVWQSEQDPFGEVSEVVNTVEQNLRFPRVLTADNIVDFHKFVFSKNGAGDIFGGDTLGKSKLGRGVINFISPWCVTPSCRL